jgi:tetratricopeptide (TPR) repeat protein
MLEAGNAEGALPHLEAAVRYDNKNVLARLNLGDAYRLLDRPADARRELEWVLKAAPNRPEVHYNLGLLYLLSKDMPGVTATQAADRAIDHLEQYKARGVRGGPDDAEELITRAKTRKALLDAQAQESKAAQAKETP